MTNLQDDHAPAKDRKCCLLAGLLNYSSTLKMEAIRSSETSGTTLRTTRRHIPDDDTLQYHRCENLKSYNVEKIRELIHEDRRRTIHELADTVGMDQLWSLPGDLNRKFEHALQCHEVCSLPLDK
jgi:hypothetical protein